MNAIVLALALILASPQANKGPSSPQKNDPKAQAKAPAAPDPSKPMFSVRLDRTAIWVGDHFHYLITVDYPPDYEFVLDNLTKETVNMDPFQVVDIRTSTVDRTAGKRLLVDLTLTEFEVGTNSVEIPQFTLYYFKKDSTTVGPEQAVAESLTIPSVPIDLRSTLPARPRDIRDAVTVNSWDRNRWIVPIAGWTCAGLLVCGAGWELAMFLKKKKTRKGPDPRKAMDAVRSRWTNTVPSDFTDPGTCLAFCDRSYRDLKEYMAFYLETPTMGLTADEMRAEMQRIGTASDLTQRVTKVAETCETLRYAPGATANADAARSLADDMRHILNSRK